MTIDRGDAPPEYVQQVRESTQQYVKELLADNDRLRSANVALQMEEKRLETAIESLGQELARERTSRHDLLALVSATEVEHREFAERYVEIERMNADLANLYVATYRMHSSLDRAQVVAAIQEVLVNLVGTEDFAVLERGIDETLHVVASFGMGEARCVGLRLGGCPLGRAIAAGVLYAEQQGADRWAEEAGVRACIPLRVDGRVTGAIVVFTLLSHKPDFEAVDHELLGLLGTHAAVALLSSALNQRGGMVQA